MKSPVNIARLFVEMIAAIAVAEAGVSFLMPVLAPGVTGLAESVIDESLLLLICGPIMFWRVRSAAGRGHRVEGGVGTSTSRSAKLVTAGVLLIGGAVSVTASRLVQQSIWSDASLRFAQLVERGTREVEERVNKPVYGLKGARGVYAASKSVERGEFNAYVASRDLRKEFPGALGFGFIQRVRREDLDRFVAAERADEAPEFDVRPVPSPSPELAGATDLWVIKFVAPMESNRAAWGVDLGSEAVRRAAVEQAMRSGEPTITAPIKLVQDQERGLGLLYLVPVYRNGARLRTPSEREESLLGLVYAPISIPGALSDLGRATEGLIDVEVFDGVRGPGVAPIFDLDGSWAPGEEPENGEGAQPRLFAKTCVVRVGGRMWTIEFSSAPAFEATVSHAAPPLVLVGGALLTLLTALSLWTLWTGRSRAMRFAQEMNADLQKAKLGAERLAEIARRTSNAVVITDKLGRVEWVNEGFTRITGYGLEDVRGRTPGSVLQGPQTDPDERAKLGRALREGRSERAELVNYGKDGRRYLVSIELTPLCDEAGEVTGFMAIESDVTERREAEAQAEAANRAKSAFLANMSHEIRTPLNGIIGFADLLAKRADGGDQAQRDEWVGIIHGSGTHLLAVLNDVLDFSKLDAGQMGVDPLPCRVVSVVTECLALLQQRAMDKGISLQSAVKEGCPLVARTDGTRLRQILTNLVGNAVKFTETGGVLVTLSGAGDGARPRLRVEVKDTGIGMSEEQVAKLFRPFGQADVSTTRKFGGTGLGLTIARALAQKLGGDIGVRSHPGLGSVFTLEIDAPPPRPGERVPDDTVFGGSDGAGEEAGKELSGRRVLVVDDNETNLKLFRLAITKAGAEVTLAENGLAALEVWGRGAYDAIVMDMQMPVMDGFSATRALRERGCVAPVLALTAYSSGADRERCIGAGCDEFLGKPVDLAVMVATLARLISGRGVAGTQAGEPSQRDPARVYGPADRCQIDDPEIRELAEDWLRGLPDRLGAAVDALARGDGEQAARIAHAIKGTSGSIGLPAFVDPAGRMENAACEGDLELAGACLEEMRRLLPRKGTWSEAA